MEKDASRGVKMKQNNKKDRDIFFIIILVSIFIAYLFIAWIKWMV